MKIIDNHIVGPECEFSFDFEEVKTKLRETRTPFFFTVADVVERTWKFGPEDPWLDKKEARLMANKTTQLIVKTLIKEKLITREKIVADIDSWLRSLMALGPIDAGAITKFWVHYYLYMKWIKNLGTEKHYDYLLRAADLSDWGCFALTELGHGSNIQNCETTAVYDHNTKEFLLNSPTETSIKFWIGNLGKTANMMVWFAQLYVEDINYGLHAFIVPIRDKSTHLPFTGCIIGDWGDKIGLQGMDNGWIEFKNYRIPVDNLLNKISRITEDGKFATTIPKDTKRFAIQVGTLSGGRVLSWSNAMDVNMFALSTAIRYGSVRKQFSRKKNQPEVSILDYPLHQARLFPLFSKSFMTHISVTKLWSEFWSNSPLLTDPNNKSVTFLHLLTSSMKPLSTWLSADAVKAARLACGGLGYSAYSNFHQYQQVADVNQTWEGENYVLIQQAWKIILKWYTDLLMGKDPIKTLEFIEPSSPEDFKFNGSYDNLNDLLELLTYKTNKLIHEAISKIQEETSKQSDERLTQNEIWEKHLNYTLIPMSKAYAERFVLASYIEWLNTFDPYSNSKDIFTKLALIGLQNQLIEDSKIYNNVISDENIEYLKESCIKLNREMKNDILAITYALPLSEKAFGVIAKGDSMYQKLMHSVKKTPGCLERVDEWKYLYQDN